MKYDVIIIGAGAAGLTAALLLKKSGITCCIIESDNPGGYMLKMDYVNDFPGITKTTGIEFAKTMLSQVNSYGVDYVNAVVESIKIEGNIKNVVTDKGTLGSEKVIIATGRTPKKLNFMDDASENKGISYNEMSDGILYKDKNIVVIGQGDSAIEAVLYLSNIVKNITLLCPDDYIKAKEIYQDHLKYLDNLKILYNTNVTGFLGSEKNVSTVKTSKGDIKCDGCFIFNGYLPKTKNFKDLGILTKEGYIETDSTMQTQVKGIYAVGDVRSKKVFELTTALSDATVAAVSIIKDLYL